jgi:methyltransferase-like protein/2-polyprenyl-3-methyl-5-hydroxy-6-metoxy-1,4-benzoquinol methylase
VFTSVAPSPITPNGLTNSYDEVPYESHPYPQTHPSRLAAVAALFGLTPPPVETARVLELGSAAGGNLIPMAEAFPGATFVGVDLSARQVADGQQAIADAGLSNVILRHASILDVDGSYGPFDYVLCHGVFSWVPDNVQEKIFDICSKHLTPNGVAYVSYNTYPGWHLRGVIRDMMRYHALKFAAPRDRTRQARALLDFLADTARQDSPYGALLKAELEALRHQADHYLYHEHLEEVNDPVYFHQFVERAGHHGLRYLGESRVGTMLTGNLGPDVDKAMKLLATDQVQTEQYMDFVRNRTFRESLLVHARNIPHWQILPERVTRLHVASAARPAADTPVDVRSEEAVQYRTPSGVSLSTTRPLLKAAMVVMGEAWPGTVPFGELLRRSRELLGAADDPKAAGEDARNLASAVLNGYLGSDVVELHGAPVAVTKAVSEKPVALAAARVRAGAGRPMANRRHEVARVTDLERHLVTLLDGTRDRPALAEAVTEAVAGGRLHLAQNGRPVTDRDEVRAAVGAILDQALANIARQALLVG